MLQGAPPTTSGTFDRNDLTLWRYAELLPVDRQYARQLGEGMTPLIRGTLAGHGVWFKNDSLLPTGSFKDRGAAVLTAHLKRLGIQRLTVDSSGNAAAAMAGYCAAHGIECTVFAPTTTSPGKLVQARAFGATVELVDGNREAVAAAAQQAVEDDEGAFYASHNWHAVFVEGVKTWALETWEQLDGAMPSTVFVPTGGGSAFVGAHRGFTSLGDSIPAIVAAQPSACAPIAATWNSGAGDISPVTPGTTLAEGTRIGAPVRTRQVMDAIRQSHGWAEAVTDERIVAALRSLWSQGLYVEPTAAVGAAAFIQAVERQPSLADNHVVILLTGSGLKATEMIDTIIRDA